MFIGDPHVHRFAGGILTIPPGFTRGLDFGPLADDPEGGLLDEEEEVEVTPIYRPMLDLTNDSKASAILVSTSRTRHIVNADPRYL